MGKFSITRPYFRPLSRGGDDYFVASYVGSPILIIDVDDDVRTVPNAYVPVPNVTVPSRPFRSGNV